MKSLLSYQALLLILFVFASNIAMAQDDATSRFIDSLRTPPRAGYADTAVAAVVDSAVSETSGTDTSGYDEAAEWPVDTAITSVLKNFRTDSLALIKKDKGFYYQSWLDSLLRAEDAKLKLRKAPVAPPDLSFLDTLFTIFKIVLWVLAVAVVVFVVYKLFLGKSALFLKSRKNIEAEIQMEEEVLSADKYEGLIKKAAADKNFRLAVRYLYLQSLYQLAEKGYVRLGSEKTNYQYAAELRAAKPDFTKPFADLTYKYEYIWYGEYSVTDAMYDSLRNSFAEFNNKIK